MFTKADKWLFKMVGLLCIPPILMIPLGDPGLVYTYFGIPCGILFGWAIVSLIEKWRKK